MDLGKGMGMQSSSIESTNTNLQRYPHEVQIRLRDANHSRVVLALNDAKSISPQRRLKRRAGELYLLVHFSDSVEAKAVQKEVQRVAD